MMFKAFETINQNTMDLRSLACTKEIGKGKELVRIEVAQHTVVNMYCFGQG